MIRFRRLTSALLDTWLVDQQIRPATSQYRLRLWREDRANLPAILTELIEYIEEAMEDARRRIRRGFEDDLSPFGDPASDPAANYPAMLHRVTLQGYFGETLAVIAVEHWGFNGQSDWAVPAFLFRLHDQEFQHLEEINLRLAAGGAYDPDQTAQMRPGRTGDDGLAFRMDDNGTITDVLTLEAKCVSHNSNSRIQEAHQKLSAGLTRPTGVRELINILDDYSTEDSSIWQRALLELWRDGYKQAVRFDAVAYACAQTPRRAPRVAWMPTNRPHPSYTAARPLEGLEFQLRAMNPLTDALYRQ